MREFFYRLFALSFCFFRLFPLQKNKVVLLLPHRAGGSLDVLEKALRRRGGIRIVRVPVAGFGDGVRAMARFFTAHAMHLATARWVFLNDNFMPMADLPFSKKADIVQLWHAEGALKTHGLSLDLPARLRRRVAKGMARYTAVICSCEAVIPYYAEAFGLPPARILPLGSPRTDLLLSPADPGARARFDAAHPDCAGKRLVLYAPTFRDNPAADALLLEHFDFPAFGAAFPETVLLLRLHPQVHASRDSADLPGGTVDVTEEEDLAGLLRLADALITDYSSICLDSAFLDVPTYFYWFDGEDYFQGRNFYVSLSELAPGPIVRDFPALLAALRTPDDARDRRLAFAAFHLGRVDGKAADRVTARFLGE
ncbi:MAG: CDP-glycerol glycerophosphotransferase family protein [Oscillospiraceae bacterium]|nr:CDP-glycerol glycerophosphotransferase family protein [Oscillospiraceae bacterium]